MWEWDELHQIDIGFYRSIREDIREKKKSSNLSRKEELWYDLVEIKIKIKKGDFIVAFQELKKVFKQSLQSEGKVLSIFAKDLRAKLLRYRGDLKAANSLCQQIIDSLTNKDHQFDPTYFLCRANFLLGSTYLHLGMNKDAKERLKYTYELSSETKFSKYKVYSLCDLLWLKLNWKSQFSELDYFKDRVLEIAKDTNIASNLMYAYNIVAIYYRRLGDLQKSKEMNLNAIELQQRYDRIYINLFPIMNLGVVYHDLGKFSLSLKYHKEALKFLHEEEFSIVDISKERINLGKNHFSLGNYDLAKSNFKQGLHLFLKLGNPFYIIWAYFYLVKVAIRLDDDPVQYLNEMETYSIIETNPTSNQLYRLAKAMILRQSERLYAQGRSFELFSQISDEPYTYFEITAHATFYKCGMLLKELTDTGSERAFKQLQSTLEHLKSMGKSNNAEKVIAKSNYIEGLLELLQSNTNRAKELIREAKLFAEKQGYLSLANIIETLNKSIFKDLATNTSIQRDMSEISSKFALVDKIIFLIEANSEEPVKDINAGYIIIYNNKDLIFQHQFQSFENNDVTTLLDAKSVKSKEEWRDHLQLIETPFEMYYKKLGDLSFVFLYEGDIDNGMVICLQLNLLFQNLLAQSDRSLDQFLQENKNIIKTILTDLVVHQVAVNQILAPDYNLQAYNETKYGLEYLLNLIQSEDDEFNYSNQSYHKVLDFIDYINDQIKSTKERSQKSDQYLFLSPIGSEFSDYQKYLSKFKLVDIMVVNELSQVGGYITPNDLTEKFQKVPKSTLYKRISVLSENQLIEEKTAGTLILDNRKKYIEITEKGRRFMEYLVSNFNMNE